MKFNPEFLEFLSGEYATAAREVIADRLQIPVDDIPEFHFDEKVPGHGNNTRGLGESETLLRVESRPDSTLYAVRVNPSAIESQAELFLAQADKITNAAKSYGVSVEDIRASLIQGAGFDVVIRSLLQVVETGADLDDLAVVREAAKQKLNLESRSAKK